MVQSQGSNLGRDMSVSGALVKDPEMTLVKSLEVVLMWYAFLTWNTVPLQLAHKGESKICTAIQPTS